LWTTTEGNRHGSEILDKSAMRSDVKFAKDAIAGKLDRQVEVPKTA
jgi:hypothetical protein